MREFNTSGPCDPEIHYTLIRKNLIVKGQEHVRKGRFFTIFGPRQTGKTTYFRLLLQKFTDTHIKPVHIRFASLKSLQKEKFFQILTDKLGIELKKHDIQIDYALTDGVDLEKYFRMIKEEHHCQILLVIDEFEGIPECVLNELMHTFRDMYHQKENHALHSMILVGVSTIAELVYTSASPFNVAEEIPIPYFTKKEMNELIDQYVSEKSQQFDQDVRYAIYHNTGGQPGLINSLCSFLVEKVATDRNKAVNMSDFLPTLQYFLTEKYDKNITNIVQKAFTKKSFMIRLLFDAKPYPFSIHNPEISWLFANGVIHNAGGYVEISVPLYSKVLISAFRPDSNGEVSKYRDSLQDNLSAIKQGDGLNISLLLQKYSDYVRQRGFQAFDTKNLKESAWHYSLDGYIHFVIEALKGQTFIEVPSGRGRTDIIIIYGQHKYIVETKIYSNDIGYLDGKIQLAEYLKSEGLDSGFYVVFSNQHSDSDALVEKENIHGKLIETLIIRTQFEQASQAGKKKRLKDKERVVFKLMDRGVDDNDIMDIAGVSEDVLLKLKLKKNDSLNS